MFSLLNETLKACPHADITQCYNTPFDSVMRVCRLHPRGHKTWKPLEPFSVDPASEDVGLSSVKEMDGMIKKKRQQQVSGHTS